MLNNDDNVNIVRKLIDPSSWGIAADSNRTQPFALIDYTQLPFADELKCSKDYSVSVLTDLQTGIPTNFSAADLEKHFAKDIGEKFVIRRVSHVPHYKLSHSLSAMKR